jgi:hypothetical protein
MLRLLITLTLTIRGILHYVKLNHQSSVDREVSIPRSCPVCNVIYQHLSVKRQISWRTLMAHLDSVQHLDTDMQQCIHDCLDCSSLCFATVPHCLEMGGEHASRDHVVTLLACAEICQTSANFMLVHSPLHGRTCGVCAEACDRCAESCERLANSDEQMMACAATCRQCAESCRKMASMTM